MRERWEAKHKPRESFRLSLSFVLEDGGPQQTKKFAIVKEIK